MRLRVLFFGTPAFAIPVLESLMRAGHEILAAVTQPDRPFGRKLVPTPPPVKTFALERGLKVLQPEKVRDPAFLEEARRLKPDLAAVAAFGQIFPPQLLAVPRLGCWNVHASLLPRHRGASPIERCLMAGEKQTGISIMKMGEGLDDGDVLAQEAIPVGDEETAGELSQRLSALGARLLVETVKLAEPGRLTPRPQDPSRAIYAPKIKKEEAQIDWEKPAEQLHNLIRALNPSVGARTLWRGEALKIWRARPVPASGASPGEVAKVDAAELVVQTGKGGLSLLELQLPGKRALPAASFLRGNPIRAGEKLGYVPKVG